MTKGNQTNNLFPQLPNLKSTHGNVRKPVQQPLDVKSPTTVPGMVFVHVEVLYKYATRQTKSGCLVRWQCLPSTSVRCKIQASWQYTEQGELLVKVGRVRFYLSRIPSSAVSYGNQKSRRV